MMTSIVENIQDTLLNWPTYPRKWPNNPLIVRVDALKYLSKGLGVKE